MKEQYFTDQRDYFKYSILRHLLEQGVRCTVCWMLTPDDGGQAGQLRDYVEDAANWRNLDPDVFDFLRSQVLPGPPEMRSIERANSPIAECRFHWDAFPAQEDQRLAYFDNCIAAARDSQLVYVDPDTGPTPANPPAANTVEKYIRWQEIAHIYNHGFSVLIYHSLQRTPAQRAGQVTNTRDRLQRMLPDAAVHALRTDDVAFYFAVHGDHNQQVQLAIESIIKDWMGPLLRRVP